MPSRNVLKIDIPDSYYHVYARGRGRQDIYHDDEDYRVFLNLFKRHLSIEAITDNYNVPYIHLRGELELLCYCLMPNHFHLLLYQIEQSAMSRLMRSVMVGYTRYYNKKYATSGSLFESTYKASRVSSDAYLQHISRYIHLNPKQWRTYEYSSLAYYERGNSPEWLQPDRIIELFPSRKGYKEFVQDYEEYKAVLDGIKHELASE